MGSINHPKFYDPEIAATIKAAYHDIYGDMVEEHDSLRISGSDTEIKAAIIQRLLDLIAEGTIRPEELKAQTLRHLPFG